MNNIFGTAIQVTTVFHDVSIMCTINRLSAPVIAVQCPWTQAIHNRPAHQLMDLLYYVIG